MTWLHIFLINWLINILCIEFLALRKIQPIINVDEARDSKYPAFRRTDIKWFNRAWLYLTCHFALAKFLFAFYTMFMCGMQMKFLVWGLKKEDSFVGIRYFLIRCSAWWCAVVVNFCGSSVIYWYYKRSDVCYKKYLGPDWEPDFNFRNAGCVIANHSTFLDSATNSLQ